MSVMMSTMVSSLLMILFSQINENTKGKMEKKTSFECGFNSISLKKMTFSTNFLLLAMMFLVFDVEISILLPFLTMNKNMEKNLMVLSNMFIITLTVLMCKEWKQGSLEWNH